VSFFQSQINNFAPFASGIRPQAVTGLEGTPFASNPLVGAIAQPMLANMMGRIGMVPMGLNDQNIYDVMRAREFQTAQRELIQQSASLERENIMRLWRSAAAMTDTPWDEKTQASATALTDSIVTSLVPTLAMMNPDALDQLSGVRGSTTVMASRMFEAGRYRLDPVTGKMGMSVDSTLKGAESVRKRLIDGDAYAQHGFSQGQLGDLYGAMQNRGLLAGGGGARNQAIEALTSLQREDPENLIKAAQATGVNLPQDLTKLSSGDLDKLRGDSAVADRLQTLDASRTARSIESYSKAVAAMRDIFGDMGKTNAPMAELIAGLEAMTQGGLSQLDPGRLSMMVRTTQQLAKNGGITMDAAMALQQHVANRAVSLGLDPTAALHAGQGSLAFNTTLRAGYGGIHAWGRSNDGELTQLDANLRVNAASSAAAYQMAAVRRIEEAAGGFGEGTRAAAYAKAIADGETSYIDPETGEVKSLMMTSQEHARMLTEATDKEGKSLGITHDDVRNMLHQKAVLQEYIEKDQLGNLGRRLQPDEIEGTVGRRMTVGLTSVLADKAGLDQETAQRVARDISRGFTKDVMGMSQADFANRAKRTEKMVAAIRDNVKGTEAEAGIAGMTDAQLSVVAENWYGLIDRSTEMSAQDLKAQMDRSMLGDTNMEIRRGRIQARAADAMTGLGKGTMVQRGIEAIMKKKHGDGTDFRHVIAEAFGGLRAEDINEAVVKPVAELYAAREEYTAAAAKADAAPAGPERDKLKASAEAKLKQAADMATELRKTFDAEGLFTSKEAADKARDVMESASLTPEGQQPKGVSREDRDPAFRSKHDNGWWQKMFSDPFTETMKDVLKQSGGDVRKVSGDGMRKEEGGGDSKQVTLKGPIRVEGKLTLDGELTGTAGGTKDDVPTSGGRA
jgi:hypothetical protein